MSLVIFAVFNMPFIYSDRSSEPLYMATIWYHWFDEKSVSQLSQECGPPDPGTHESLITAKLNL